MISATALIETLRIIKGRKKLERIKESDGRWPISAVTIMIRVNNKTRYGSTLYPFPFSLCFSSLIAISLHNFTVAEHQIMVGRITAGGGMSFLCGNVTSARRVSYLLGWTESFCVSLLLDTRYYISLIQCLRNIRLNTLRVLLRQSFLPKVKHFCFN